MERSKRRRSARSLNASLREKLGDAAIAPAEQWQGGEDERVGAGLPGQRAHRLLEQPAPLRRSGAGDTLLEQGGVESVEPVERSALIADLGDRDAEYVARGAGAEPQARGLVAGLEAWRTGPVSGPAIRRPPLLDQTRSVQPSGSTRTTPALPRRSHVHATRLGQVRRRRVLAVLRHGPRLRDPPRA